MISGTHDGSQVREQIYFKSYVDREEWRPKISRRAQYKSYVIVTLAKL